MVLLEMWFQSKVIFGHSSIGLLDKQRWIASAEKGDSDVGDIVMLVTL